ncbi:MAG: C40 family peptidase [Lachnospiraceae bacterium]|nr:C40 family peptidase [Lachnospiraceae bacterium]
MAKGNVGRTFGIGAALTLTMALGTSIFSGTGVGAASLSSEAKLSGVKTIVSKKATSKTASSKSTGIEGNANEVGFYSAKNFRKTGISIASDYVNIRKKANTSSKVLGKLYCGSGATIIKNGKKWAKVKSGDITGYVCKDYLAIGSAAAKVAKKYGIRYIIVGKKVSCLNVRKRKSTKSTILTKVTGGESYTVLSNAKKWVRISVDDSKGYVAKDYVLAKVKLKEAVAVKSKKTTTTETTADETTSTEDTTSKEDTTDDSTSSDDGSYITPSGQGASVSKIVKYALQFEGNPYVYGGTSLTKGCDCSGFVMSIYAHFGYSLPRTSRAQSVVGKKVKFSNLKKGDLIFYKNDSVVGHVALYIGDGKVIHASNPSTGIKISVYNYRTPYCARRIVG